MKKYEEPKLNVQELEMEDVITTSITTDDDCGYQLPCDD